MHIIVPQFWGTTGGYRSASRWADDTRAVEMWVLGRWGGGGGGSKIPVNRGFCPKFTRSTDMTFRGFCPKFHKSPEI